MNLVKICLISLLLCFIYTEDGHNHGSWDKGGMIMGVIIDEITELPKEYASISLVQVETDETIAGGISDSDGHFFIGEVPFGKYIVIIEYIGYDKYLSEEFAVYPTHLKIDLETVKIIPKMLKLDAVTVTEAAPIIEEVAKTIYPVKDTARESGGSAEEVLEQIPGVTLDIDGNLSLRGNSNVTILIDGRKTGVSIDMLNANMIETVEVMTTPSAKYDPDGIAGIINIILNKNMYTGKSAKIGLNLSEWNGKNLSTAFNVFQNDWNLFTNLSFKDKYKKRNVYRNTITSNINTGVETERISYLESTDRYPEVLNAKMGLERYFNEKDMLAFDITYIHHDDMDSTFSNTVITAINPNDNDLSTARIAGDGRGDDLNYGIGYFRENNDSETSLSIQYDYDDHDDEFKSTYIDIEAIETTIDLNRDKGNDKTFMVDYIAPLTKFSLFKINEHSQESEFEVGLKYNNAFDKNYHYIEDESINFSSDNKLFSLYFNTQYNFTKSFGLQVGARLESQERSFDVDLSQLVNDELSCSAELCNVFNEALDKLDVQPSFTYEHNRVYPSIYLLYDLSKTNKLKFGAGRRINRGGFHGESHDLYNPLPDVSEYQNKFIHQGNSELKPEDIIKAELSFTNTTLGFFKTTIFYDEITEKVDRDLDIVCIGTTCDDEGNDSDQTDYSVLSWDNVGKTRSNGIEMVFVTRPLPSWNVTLYGSYWNNETTEASEEDQIGNEHGFWGMMVSEISLKNNQKINIYSHRSSPMKITTGEIAPFERMDISYKKKVNDKFNFSLKLKDAFDTSGFGIQTNRIITEGGIDYNQYLEAESRRSRRTISINFEYRFGEFEKKKYRREDHGGHDHGDGDGGRDQGF